MKAKILMSVIIFFLIQINNAQNETVNGDLNVNGTTTINTNNDAVMNFSNTDNSWQYLQFLQSGVRKTWLGLDTSNNFNISKENGGNIIFQGGNVGIGTTNPTSRLHINGLTKLNPGAVNNNFLQVQSNHESQLNLVFFNGNEAKWNFYSSSNDKFYFRKTDVSGNGGVKMTLHGDNVGIGDDNPVERLHVEGNVLLDAYNQGNESGIFFRQGFNSSTNKYNSSILNYDHSGSGSTPDGISINAYDGVSFSTGSNLRNERMRIHQNGNVGIGTINPASKLEVNGDISLARSNKIKFLTASGGDDRAYIRSTDGEGGNYNSLIFAVGAGNESMIIKANSGDVGIGTTTPDSKLTVKGKVHAEEVKVDLSVPGPDYVFAEDYKLTSLRELQQYIQENNHLPNIPSAKEMEANGIELGVMNMKLLEKIEELTLYTINQEERIKNLETKNEKLLKVVEQLLEKKH